MECISFGVSSGGLVLGLWTVKEGLHFLGERIYFFSIMLEPLPTMMIKLNTSPVPVGGDGFDRFTVVGATFPTHVRLSDRHRRS